MKIVKITILFLLTLFIFGSITKTDFIKKHEEYMKSKPTVCHASFIPPIHNLHVFRFINDASIKTGLSIYLIDAIITIESRGVITAKSPTGPYGLMQISKAVSKEYGLDRNIPYENVLAGSLYLKDLLNEYGSLEYALAAYNLGPGGLKENGIDSARSYINKVIRIYNRGIKNEQA